MKGQPRDIFIGPQRGKPLPGSGGSGEGGADLPGVVAAALTPLPELALDLPEGAEARRLLIIGGSGFISGALATAAMQSGYDVTVVTRGQRPVPMGVHALTADRTHPGELEAALAAEKRRTGQKGFSLVVDCIGYRPADALQDIALFGQPGTHLVFISDDAVYDPARRSFPQVSEGAFYVEDASPAGLKRRCETLFLQAAPDFTWTILRPTLVLGPGRQDGFFPPFVPLHETVAALKAGRPIPLPDGGHWLVQPICVYDLADIILGCPKTPAARSKVFDCGGPQILEVRQLYLLMAEQFSVNAVFEETGAENLSAEAAGALCHRFYCNTPLAAAGLPVPAHTPAQAIAAMFHLI